MIIKHNNINLYNIFGDSPKIDISYHLSINLYDMNVWYFVMILIIIH